MRRTLATLAALLLLAFNASAQLGFMAGVTTTLSSIESGSITAADITQYHAGIAFKKKLGILALQPGILYNIKGEQLKGDDYKAILKTGFVEIPLQVQLGISVADFRPFVFGEPYLGFAVTNSTTDTYSSEGYSGGYWDTVSDRLEFGFAFGAGIDILRHLQVCAKYVYNSRPIYYSNTLSGYDLTQQKCAGIMVTAAIFF